MFSLEIGLIFLERFCISFGAANTSDFEWHQQTSLFILVSTWLLFLIGFSPQKHLLAVLPSYHPAVSSVFVFGVCHLFSHLAKAPHFHFIFYHPFCNRSLLLYNCPWSMQSPTSQKKQEIQGRCFLSCNSMTAWREFYFLQNKWSPGFKSYRQWEGN